MEKNIHVVAIYDNGGKTTDRYTVYFNTKDKRENWYPCLAMNNYPFDPQGFCQHSSGLLGRHNGKRIAFSELPLDCQKAVRQDLGI